MPYQQKQFTRSPQKQRTRRRDEHALTNVVSLRISDQEKRTLEKIMKTTSRSVSDIIREAMIHWIAKRQKLGLDGVS